MDELEGKIASLIKEELEIYAPLNPTNWAEYQGIFLAAKILKRIKEAEYVQLDPDQSLPHNSYPRQKYGQAQQDMLKAGFRKVKI